MSIELVMSSNHLSHPVISLSSWLLSFPASGSFPVTWLFVSGGKSIGVSALASVLPVTIQGWFPLGLTGLIWSASHTFNYRGFVMCSISGRAGPSSQLVHFHHFPRCSVWTSVQVWLALQKLLLLRFLMKLRCPNQEQGIFKSSFVFSGIISSCRFLHIFCLFLNSVSFHRFHIIS